ncbi:hypothetical protein CEXT_277081 [Caerostris extrusa]|uniref:Uncharacterized protein n=1 Tax=Caerostris extrusa TaxID=172846 RepID=A0AAV4WM07_CAEEX|nr:hypothetical protein CEXT_277081 [Caerostris extrusa]
MINYFSFTNFSLTSDKDSPLLTNVNKPRFVFTETFSAKPNFCWWKGQLQMRRFLAKKGKLACIQGWGSYGTEASEAPHLSSICHFCDVTRKLVPAKFVLNASLGIQFRCLKVSAPVGCRWGITILSITLTRHILIGKLRRRRILKTV